VTSHERTLGRNVLVALGLWWCFSFVGSLVVWTWTRMFLENRGFSGTLGSVMHVALSLPGYVISGVLVGLGVARYIESPRVVAWAAGLAGSIALADSKSWNAMLYSGRSVSQTVVTAVAIVASIIGGCWVGVRLKAARLERGQVA
jgi:hypothetical protein